MPVGWIEHFYNNTSKPLMIKCVDSSHLGSVRQIDGGGRFSFNNEDWHAFDPNTRWVASWCGIPWYSNDPPLGHYREISLSDTKSVMFYQSFIDDNYIMFINVQSGREVARIPVSRGSDYHCDFRWEDEGPYFDIRNTDGTPAVLGDINDQVRGWVQALGGAALATAIKAAAA